VFLWFKLHFPTYVFCPACFSYNSSRHEFCIWLPSKVQYLHSSTCNNRQLTHDVLCNWKMSFCVSVFGVT
jgi:hypothetical protein